MGRLLLALAILLATIAPALAVGPAYACSCAAPEAGRSVGVADVVVVGTVDRIDAPRDRPDGGWSSTDPVGFTVSAERYLKGAGGPVLTVNTARSGASCGALEVLDEGERHVLLLQADEGAYTTGLCDGNSTLLGTTRWGGGDATDYLAEIEAITGEGTPPDPDIGPGRLLDIDGGRLSPLTFAIPGLLGGLALVAGGALAIRRRRSR